jgi:hypothetical protein
MQGLSASNHSYIHQALWFALTKKVEGIVPNLVAHNQLSIEEIDRLIENLEKGLDSSNNLHGSQSDNWEGTLHFEFPQEIWSQFVEYCKQNELNPAQQLREAVASYYKDLLKIYRIRIRLNSIDNSSGQT